MTDEALELTCYFGERSRVEGRFVADVLLDRYGQAQVASCVLLRGIEGFGLRHHLRTDHSLSLSEDLPLVVVAVDRRDRIEDLVGPAAALMRPGLLTLEHARLLRRGDDAGVGPVAHAHDGPDSKLTVYLGRRERVGGRPTFVALCETLHRHGLGGATALLGVDGTAHGHRERARFFGRNEDVPMVVVTVGSTEAITRALPEVTSLLAEPLLTFEPVTVCKRDGQLLTRPPVPDRTDEDGLTTWQKLMVVTSEATMHQGQPVHLALMRALREGGALGATTLRGMWGFHGDHRPHGDRFLQLGRRAPIVTTVIEHPERIDAVFDIIDDLTGQRGLVTSEAVPALQSVAEHKVHGGLRLSGVGKPTQPRSPGEDDR